MISYTRRGVYVPKGQKPPPLRRAQFCLQCGKPAILGCDDHPNQWDPDQHNTLYCCADCAHRRASAQSAFDFYACPHHADETTAASNSDDEPF